MTLILTDSTRLHLFRLLLQLCATPPLNSLASLHPTFGTRSYSNTLRTLVSDGTRINPTLVTWWASLSFLLASCAFGKGSAPGGSAPRL